MPHRLEVTVSALVPEFGLVYVRALDGAQFVLTPETPGLGLYGLRPGQPPECLISAGLPRVLSAKVK